MKSRTTKKFRECFSLIPKEVKELAKKNYKLWLQNHYSNGLRFKSIDKKDPRKYSIRIGSGYRALGDYSRKEDVISWYWIGTHEDYNNLL